MNKQMASITKIQHIIQELQQAAGELNIGPSQISEKLFLANNQAHPAFEQTPSFYETEVITLKNEIDVLTESLSRITDQHKNSDSELSILKDENQRLAQALYDAQKESTINKNINESLLTENGILLNQILQVQTELEQYYADKSELELALKASTASLEKARVAIVQLANND